MELRIDKVTCDVGLQSLAIPGFNAAMSANLEVSRVGRTLQITIPRTARNDVVMEFARDMAGAPKFNETLHRAELTQQGAQMIAGTVRLLKASDEGYTLEIRGGGALWARNAARRMLNTLDVEYDADITPLTILESWTNTAPVKFFPISRDEYPQLNSSQELLPAERVLSVDDYHPFLHLATLVEQVFADSGYGVESNFLGSAFFRSLYMSGAYSSRDTTVAASRMGFFARKLANTTAAADYGGRVYANPTNLANSVGNFVDTATPQTLDADDQPIPELYNNGGCFSIDNQRIRFTPLAEVSVSFEYYIKYTTDHRILSRTRLKGFDSVYLGEGGDMPFMLANRYQDHRPAVRANTAFLLVIFNFVSGEKFRVGSATGNGQYMVATWTVVNARAMRVTTPATLPVGTMPLLQVQRDNTWVEYLGDWALYDGYLSEKGTTTVELRMRAPAEVLSPSSHKYFNYLYFYGADAGMKLTLHKESSLRPCFVSSPGFGASITFADVAQHRIRQLELLEAVSHLFNLRFYTEEVTKKVFVEPADDFLGAGVEADWLSKSDFLQPIEVEDIAQEVAETRVWGYREGDGAVKRFNAEVDATLGEWTTQTDSFAAKWGEEQNTSPLFHPTVSVSGKYLSAKSAQIMQVGDRDALEFDGTNFSPRIVRYEGMKALRTGERWGYPSSGTSYPLAAFHFAGDSATNGFTLCFENRDAVTGLHRFYDQQVAQDSLCERITLSLQLAPHEFESLFVPGTGMPDVRSVFRLNIGGKPLRATLHTLGNYDPHKGSVRCTFTRRRES